MKIHFRNRLLILLFLLAVNGQAQPPLSIVKSEKNLMALSGTSTLHDWTMKTSSFSGHAVFDHKNLVIKGIESLDFSLIVAQLKSGKKVMDNNAYKALKTDQFKTIQYNLSSAKILDNDKSIYRIQTMGTLVVAGVSKPVTIDIFCSALANGNVSCTGKYSLKMTDYNVNPPNFLGGVMSTGETVTLNFTMVFETPTKQPMATSK